MKNPKKIKVYELPEEDKLVFLSKCKYKNKSRNAVVEIDIQKLWEYLGLARNRCKKASTCAWVYETANLIHLRILDIPAASCKYTKAELTTMYCTPPGRANVELTKLIPTVYIKYPIELHTVYGCFDVPEIVAIRADAAGSYVDAHYDLVDSVYRTVQQYFYNTFRKEK